MSPEWLTAIGTLGTFVVIAASAIAALLQLRHLGRSNQIAAFDELRQTMESADFRKALNFVLHDLSARFSEANAAATTEEIRRHGLQGELDAVRLVANMGESMGLFVRSGMVDKFIACQLWAAIISRSWDHIVPVTRILRSEVDPAIWVNFEYMAALSKQYKESGAGRDYPTGFPRLPLDEPLPRD